MQDIRVDDSFFDHPKTVRFYRRTGDHGIACLFRLWCYTSKYFPKGTLDGMGPEEIADAAKWKGNPQEFMAALVGAGGEKRAGFLDVRCDLQYALHNWRKRNPFAFFRAERSEVSRMAAEIRWSKKRKPKRKQPEDAKGNAGSNAERNAPAPIPSPIPSPLPIKEKSVDSNVSVGEGGGAKTAGGGVLGAPPPPAPDPVERLGEAIRRRRQELGIPEKGTPKPQGREVGE